MSNRRAISPSNSSATYSRRQPSDGGLRRIFSDCFKEAQWTSIESRLTAGGIPDVEYCFPGGKSGWIEFKKTESMKIHHLRPLQVAWIDRRSRLGGKVFLAVRYISFKKQIDRLYLIPGISIKDVAREGLGGLYFFGLFEDGPGFWDWNAIRKMLQ
jgi:hypothetical protein